MRVTKEQISGRTGEDDTGFSLSECSAVAKLPATDIERARRFYAEKLGLTGTPGAAPGNHVYQCGGSIFGLYESRERASGTHGPRTGIWQTSPGYRRADYDQKFPREHLRNSRTEPQGVFGCRFVLGRDWVNLPGKNPAYSPR
jgi:hypothetical protein